MPNLPEFSTYCNYKSDNYGTRALRFDHEGNTFWFSYKTLIAFRAGPNRYVRTNDWGPTTGKHLNAIDGGDKKARLSSDDFEAAYAKEFTQ